MTSAESSEALLQAIAATRSELDGLVKHEAQLETALDDLEHESRRCNDALERSGWRSATAEARGAMLAENRAVIVLEREKIRTLRAQLSERLELLESRLHDAP
jgi:ABC-type transporter Mla subunit MlaD